MDKMKVVIHVEGGVVQAVYSWEQMDVEIIDFDSLLREGLTRKECKARLDAARLNLPPQYEEGASMVK